MVIPLFPYPYTLNPAERKKLQSPTDYCGPENQRDAARRDGCIVLRNAEHSLSIERVAGSIARVNWVSAQGP